MFWNLKLKLHIKLGIIILLSLGILWVVLCACLCPALPS